MMKDALKVIETLRLNWNATSSLDSKSTLHAPFLSIRCFRFSVGTYAILTKLNSNIRRLMGSRLTMR